MLRYGLQVRQNGLHEGDRPMVLLMETSDMPYRFNTPEEAKAFGDRILASNRSLLLNIVPLTDD